MNIEEIVKENKTYNIFLKESIKKAEMELSDDEKVTYAIGGNMSIMDNNEALNMDFLKIKGKIAGVLVITNKRVMFCNSTMGFKQVKEIPINQIQSIDSKDILLFRIGKLRIKGLTETFVMEIGGKGIVEEAKKAINESRSEVKEIKEVSQASSADEIMKFKQLLDQGIITQEEFEKKKQELLK